MLSLLHSQLENERAIHKKLVDTNRKDLIARMLLERIAKEIKTLEDRINDQTPRKESPKLGYSRGFTQYVCEALRRFRNHKDRRNYSIFTIPASPILQTSAGVK